MPRLSDLLEYLAFPENKEIWLLLDIKVLRRCFQVLFPLKLTGQLDNDGNDIMRLIAETLKQVPAHPQRAWNQRVVLGCWAVRKRFSLSRHWLNF